ncbi:NAD-dependent epimerase/dehydratase family protein [Neisseria sp. P0022.S007]|uniref:NAD-dependent epimerase/dehydratase family protein n=1 Tax=unclassified Neisseria TaxID=2623750 RepID=UPI003F7DC130
MNIIIFGGSGFIGKRTVQILKEQGHQVCTPDRRAFDFLHPNETAARRLLEGQDVLINCIGIMSRHAEILEPAFRCGMENPRRLRQRRICR